MGAKDSVIVGALTVWVVFNLIIFFRQDGWMAVANGLALLVAAAGAYAYVKKRRIEARVLVRWMIIILVAIGISMFLVTFARHMSMFET
jgi:branched-subunit amino acid ABC-type transport system permease component